MSADEPGGKRDAQAMALFLLTKHRDEAAKLALALRTAAIVHDDAERARYWDQVLTVISATKH